MKNEIELYRDIITLLDTSLQKELRAQGHYLTGSLEASINGRIYPIAGGYEMRGYALYYGNILDEGVRPDRIPFELSGNGGTSQYIAGLIAFWRKRGLSPKEAKSAAFATAIKHKKEGMSTEASSKYSKTGFRNMFIKIVEKHTDRELDRRMDVGIESLVDAKFNSQKSETI